MNGLLNEEKTMARQASAFTLVELLVVLSILFMLIGMIMNGRPDYNRVMRHAVFQGDLAKCRELVDKKRVSPNNYPRCLGYAAMEGHLEICKYLVEELHTPVDSPRYLFDAANSGNGDVIQYFLDQGLVADQKAANSSGETLLVSAARGGNFDFCKRLVDEGADIDANNSKPICMAAVGGHTEVYRLLVEHKAKVPFEGVVYLNMTLLHWAAQGGSAEICRDLIERGADVSAVSTKDRIMPLHRAAMRSRSESSRVLIEAGADVNAIAHEYGEDRSPLDFAARTSWDDDHAKTIEVLISAGAKYDLNKRYGSRMLPAIAAARGNIELLERFAAEGVDLKRRDFYYSQDSLLHLAARGGQVEMCDWLLENGFDKNARNEEKETPLIAAASENRTAVCRFLLEKGADPKAVGKKGNALRVAQNYRPRWSKRQDDSKELVELLQKTLKTDQKR